MNLHFIYILLDILIWFMIAAIFCSQLFLRKSYRANLSKTTIFSVIIISLCAGFFSVLINGVPDLGLSTSSFAYASFVPFGLIVYTQAKHKKMDNKIKFRKSIKQK